MTEPRLALQRLIEERREDYASLSRLIGRNAAYVQQYIKRGIPKRLAEEDRRLLARYFQVPEERLGGLPPPERSESHIVVPQLDVGASAGAGAFPGEYRVLIMPPPEKNRAAVPTPRDSSLLDRRYASYETSGLRCVVTRERRRNDFTIEVDRPARSKVGPP